MPLETTQPITADTLLAAGWKRKMGAWVSPETKRAMDFETAVFAEALTRLFVRLLNSMEDFKKS